MQTRKNKAKKSPPPLRRSKRLNKGSANRALSQRRQPKKPRIEQPKEAEHVQLQEQHKLEYILNPEIQDSSEELKNTRAELQQTKEALKLMEQLHTQNITELHKHAQAFEELRVQLQRYLLNMHTFALLERGKMNKQMQELEERIKTAEDKLTEVLGAEARRSDILQNQIMTEIAFELMPDVEAFKSEDIADVELSAEIEKELSASSTDEELAVTDSEDLEYQLEAEPRSEEVDEAIRKLAIELEQITSSPTSNDVANAQLVTQLTVHQKTIAELEQSVLSLTALYLEEKRLRESAEQQSNALYLCYGSFYGGFQPADTQALVAADQPVQSRSENEEPADQSKWQEQPKSANSSPTLSNFCLAFLASPSIASPIQMERQELPHSAIVPK